MQELNYKAPKPFIYNNIRNKSSFLFDCCKSAIKLIGFQHNVRHSIGFFIEVDGKTTEYYVEFVIDGAMNVFQNDNEDCFNFQPSAIFISSLKDWLDSNIEVIQHSKAYEQVFNNHFNRL